MSTLSHTTVDSPVGPLSILVRDDALVAIEFGSDPAEPTPDVVEVEPDEHPMLLRVVGQLAEYFAGDRTDFDVPVDPAGTPFQRMAWAELRRIPFGETITYGEQARRLGDSNKSRAVGAANGRNPIPIVVPCHRVVGSNGHLVGFAGGLDTKAWLLDHERRVRVGRD